MLEDVERVGALVQEQPIGMPLHNDAEEVVKRPRSFIANSHWRAEIVRHRSSVLEAIRIMSSTYKNRYTVSELRRKTNREVSNLASANPSESRKDVNQLYQAWGACFSPYRDFFRRQTKSG
jgi:hypothetical protein